MSANRGFSRLTLMAEPDNEPALALYRKLGFVSFKESVEMWKGKPLPTLRMRKPLP